MTHNQQVRTLQIVTHTIAIGGLYFATPELLLTSLLIYWFIGVVGINIGFHRLLSHRSFETYKPIEYFASLVGTITGVGSPLAWCAVHRAHHMYAETEKDPHSPYQIGNFRAWFGFWDIPRLNPRVIKDLRKSKFHKFIHSYYIPINIAYAAVLGLIDPLLIVYGYAIPAVLVLHSTSAIIVIAHRHGYKTYDVNDESRNSWIASLITLGEGWHNNHHANSRDWNNQHRWWELDPPAWIIRAIKK